jgi:hypothetical protein
MIWALASLGYLGSAEKVAALLKERTAPLPLSATRRELGLPGAPWLAAQESGVFALLQPLWGPLRSLPGSLPAAGGDCRAALDL